MKSEEFVSKLKQCKKAPFLFVGSGFARHYTGAPTWEGILERFAPKPLNQYKSILNTTYLPTIATAIAKDLTNEFWSRPETDSFRSRYANIVTDQSQVLKLMISEYLSSLSSVDFPEALKEEIRLLRSLNIDGIITTNWDDVAERLFPSYSKFIGQNQLIVSSTFSIGEIYKIHGCITSPRSLVLTESDYQDFNDKNAYLAAKLITIFVEHPVVFMGYSISDSNIRQLLQSVVRCMGQDSIQRLQDNLIFVNWLPEENAELTIEQFDMTMDGGIILPVTRIDTHDYKAVYQCLSYYERSIPAALLREYKKQFYEIVVSEHPEKSLHVLPDTKSDALDRIQVVYGFGAIKNYLAASGYTGLSSVEICRDVISDGQLYNPELILKKSIPSITQGNARMFIPVYKYLRAIGINNESDYQRNQLGVNFVLKKGPDFASYSFPQIDKEKSLQEAITSYSGVEVWKAIALIPYLNITIDDLPLLASFINEHLNEFLVKKHRYSTFMRKLICYFDWKKYGWE